QLEEHSPPIVSDVQLRRADAVVGEIEKAGVGAGGAQRFGHALALRERRVLDVSGKIDDRHRLSRTAVLQPVPPALAVVEVGKGADRFVADGFGHVTFPLRPGRNYSAAGAAPTAVWQDGRRWFMRAQPKNEEGEKRWVRSRDSR